MSIVFQVLTSPTFLEENRNSQLVIFLQNHLFRLFQFSGTPVMLLLMAVLWHQNKFNVYLRSVLPTL